MVVASAGFHTEFQGEETVTHAYMKYESLKQSGASSLLTFTKLRKFTTENVC